MSYPYLSDVVQALTGLALPLPLPMFGLFVAFAMLAGSHALTLELKRLHAAGRLSTASGVAPHEIVPNLTLVVMAAGIAGARLFHILENLDEFRAAPQAMIFSTSGLSIFGGLILGTLAGVLFVRRHKLPLLPTLDAAAPAMMLGYAIGRIGCQVSGDGDWGGAANLALKPDWLPLWTWAQTYDNNVVGAVIAAPGVYPTPMYEALMAFACFAVLWALRRHGRAAGWLFSVYMLLAGAERLLIEQIRINPVFDFGGVRATQAEMIAAVLIAVGAAGTVLLAGRRGRDGSVSGDKIRGASTGR